QGHCVDDLNGLQQRLARCQGQDNTAACISSAERSLNDAFKQQQQAIQGALKTVSDTVASASLKDAEDQLNKASTQAQQAIQGVIKTVQDKAASTHLASADHQLNNQFNRLQHTIDDVEHPFSAMQDTLEPAVKAASTQLASAFQTAQD